MIKNNLLLCWMICLGFSGRLSAQKSELDSLYQLGFDKAKLNEFEASTAALLKANVLAERENNIAVLCKIQMLMGKNGLLGENNTAVIEAFKAGTKYCEACGDTLNLARLYLQQGVLQIKLDDLDQAVVWFNKSADFYMVKKDTMGALNALTKIGNVLERQQRYQEANTYYIRYYNAVKDNPGHQFYLTANIYLASNYLELKQPEKARFHNELVKYQAFASKSYYEYAQALRYEAIISYQMGNFKDAFLQMRHFAEYSQDTMFNLQSMQQIEELKAKYEAEKKETQIALQASELQRQRLQFWIAVAGLAVLSLVGGVLFVLARRLRRRNREKEVLIKEIHHRVKNNLQILSSLLHLQSRHIQDEAALGAVREGQNRVDAMGLIHQKLYMGDHVAQVEMKDYLQEFGQSMLDSFGIHDERVRVEYDVEPLYLDVDTAIPLGLIINELVSNSLKYAFPEGRKGRISITLLRDEASRLQLRVSDDGVGAVSSTPLGTGFGSNLVKMLSKKLKGKVEISSGPEGYSTQIIFD